MHVWTPQFNYPQPGGEYVTSVKRHPPRYLKVHPMSEPAYVLPVISTVERDGRLHMTLGDRMDEVPDGDWALSLYYGALSAG